MNFYNPYSPYNSPNQFYGAQQQCQPTNTNKMFVGGITEIKAKILPPNSDWIFLDRDKSIIYNTRVDANGQFSITAYDVTEHKEQEATANQGTIDLSNYVPRDEFTVIQGEIQALKDSITKLSKGVSNGTTNGQQGQQQPVSQTKSAISL